MSYRSWMSTLNITALTALLVAIAAFLYVQPRLQANPTSYNKTILQDDSQAELLEERIWLVVYQMNPSPLFSNDQPRLAEDAQRVDLSLPQNASERIQGILKALKTQMSLTAACANASTICNDSFWPDALGIPEVFLSELGNNGGTVILNFPLDTNVQLSIQQEEALKVSIVETLDRNNINNSLWLINDEARPLFLQHIALQSDLR